jgi:pyruvate formate lyase activating enzyme
MTKQALDTIAPYLNAANVDLKSFSEEYYKKTCKARLQPVLDSIAYIKKLGIWLEVTTLVVPGENDSDEELGQIASFVAGIDPDIPWHISRFRPDYEMIDHEATPIEKLHRARDIGRSQGLGYIYLGNVMENTDTYCRKCGALLLKRAGPAATANNLRSGACPSCQTPLAGVWESPALRQTASRHRGSPQGKGNRERAELP